MTWDTPNYVRHVLTHFKWYKYTDTPLILRLSGDPIVNCSLRFHTFKTAARFAIVPTTVIGNCSYLTFNRLRCVPYRPSSTTSDFVKQTRIHEDRLNSAIHSMVESLANVQPLYPLLSERHHSTSSHSFPIKSSIDNYCDAIS